MRRKLFSIGAALSAVLCGTTLIALVASCFWRARIGHLTVGMYPDGREDGHMFNGLAINAGGLAVGYWGEWREWPTDPFFASRLPPRPPTTFTSRWHVEAVRHARYSEYPAPNPVWPGYESFGMSMQMTAEVHRFLSLPL